MKRIEEMEKKTIIGNVVDICELYPQRVALVSGEARLTYGELLERVSTLAEKLRIAGVKPGGRVALSLPHSAEYIISILSILLNGAAYVPIDPSFPEARIEQILFQCGARFFITDRKKQMDGVRQLSPEAACFADRSGKKKGAQLEKPTFGGGESTAYIIFTSGSTGEPKGIPIRNKSVIHLTRAFRNWIRPEETHRILLMASFGFDMSVFQMFFALMSGQTLDVLPDGIKEDPTALLHYIDAHKITVMDVTPLYLEALSELLNINEGRYGVPQIIISSGEAMPLATARHWFAHPETEKTLLLNCYGPTEACVYASVFPITSLSVGSLEKMCIGKPIEGVKIHVLDDRGRLLPAGETGELYIQGPGLSAGYMGLSELTAKSFIKVPEIAGEEYLYRTGDYGYVSQDGWLYYLGRRGDQVKIRGYRIELGEIQVRLHNIEGIRDCRVLARAQGRERRLVAYFSADRRFTPDELDQELGRWLPAYMIPSCYVPVDHFEKTANGKLDKEILPDYRKNALSREAGQTEIIDRKDLETVLSLTEKIFIEGAPDLNKSILEQGGTSLHCFSLSAWLQAETGIFISAVDLMRSESIARIANMVSEARCRTDESTQQRAGGTDDTSTSETSETTAFQRLILTEEKKARRLMESRSMKIYPMYNVIYRVKISARLEIERLKAALAAVIAANDGLRMVFVKHNKEMYLRHADVKPEAVFESVTVDDAENEQNWQNTVVFFDVEQAPLFRISLIEDQRGDQVMVCNFHHSIFDYCSMRIFMEQLLGQYQSAEKAQLRTGSFFKYIRMADKDIRPEDQKYWREYYRGRGDCVFLPGDRSNKRIHRMERFEQLEFAADGELYKEICEICRKNAVTTYAYTFSCFVQTVMKYLNSSDVVIGTYMNSRDILGGENMNTIGLITSMTGIRFREEKESGVRFVHRTQRNLNECSQHLALPFHEVYAVLEPADQTGGRLYEMTYNYILEKRIKVNGTGLTYDFQEIGEEPVTIPFALKGFERETKIIFRLKYCTQIYSKEYVKIFRDKFINTLRMALEPNFFE